MNKVVLGLGLLLYSFYFIGLFFKDISGLSLFYVIVFIVAFFIKSEINFNKKALFFLLSFNVLIFSSIIMNIKTDYSLYKTQMLFFKFNSLFLMPQFLDKKYINSFPRGLFYILLIVILVIFTSCVGSLSSYNVNHRLEIGFLNPIWITRIAMECLILYFFFFKHTTIKTMSLLFLILPVIYASGSKGPIFAFILTAIFYLMKDKKISFKNFKLVFGCLFVLSVCGVIYYKLIQYDNFLTQRFLTVVPENLNEDAIEENRALFLPVILNNFFNQDYLTILFGAGIGNTSKIFYGIYINDRFHPHNILVEFLCEFGLVFALLLIIVVIVFFRKTCGPFKYLFLYYFINSMFSGDIILNEYIFLYAGLVIATNSNLKKYYENYLPNDRELL